MSITKYWFQISLISVGLALIIMVLTLIVRNPERAFGEVAVGSQTVATNTPQLVDLTNLCPTGAGQASSTTGVLDFVNLLTPSTGGYIAFYDATTSDVNKRTNNLSSSTILLAWFPPGTGTTTGPYKLGVGFNYGLLVDTTSGMATATIGYRCGS